MSVYWWVVAALLGLCGVAALLGWVGYLWSGDDRWRDFAVRSGRWLMVFALASFNITIFKHLIETLLGG